MELLNAYMHPRNIYKKPLKFDLLCSQYPELSKYTTKKPSGKLIFNFKDRDGLRCLCTILLKKDFDLDVIIPENTLIPTLPLRLNYILWIEDLLQNGQISDDTRTITGIDIGTGTTCIYPLLSARKNGWKMLGTDVTDEIIDTARQNVDRNNLNHLITVNKTSSSLSESLPNDQSFDFCMCNPPFFDSSEPELSLTLKLNRVERRKMAKLQASGTPNETSSPGGEVTFIRNIIEDSLKLQDRVRIYTSMIGCKSSLQPVLDILKDKGVHSVCQTRFCQGRTMRWAVAWTFTKSSLLSSPALPSVKKLPKPLTWTLRPELNYRQCIGKMSDMFEKLQIHFTLIQENKKSAVWNIEARRNTWTGLRRQRREQQRKKKSDPLDDHQMNTESEEKCSTVPSSSIESSKRKANFENDDHQIDYKKARFEEEPDVMLRAKIELKKLHNNKDGNISIQIVLAEGPKEAPQQLLQYFKNNLVQNQ